MEDGTRISGLLVARATTRRLKLVNAVRQVLFSKNGVPKEIVDDQCGWEEMFGQEMGDQRHTFSARAMFDVKKLLDIPTGVHATVAKTMKQLISVVQEDIRSIFGNQGGAPISVGYIGGAVMMRFGRRIPSQIVHFDSGSEKCGRATELSVIIPFTTQRGPAFFDLLSNGTIPFVTPKVDAGDMIAFAAAEMPHTGICSASFGKEELVGSSLFLSFEVTDSASAFAETYISGKVDPSANQFLLCGIEQPAVLLCACCMHPIHDRQGCEVCSMCLSQLERKNGRLPVGDLGCVVCSVCCTNVVEATSHDEVRELRASNLSTVVRYMINSIMIPHTDDSDTMLLCEHDATHRVSAIKSIPTILMYFTKNELHQTALWFLKVVLRNALVRSLLDPRVADLSDVNIVCGEDCPRSAMLIDVLFRSVGIHYLDMPVLGSRSLCMGETAESMVVVMQERVESLARILQGLSMSPMNVSTLESNFVTSKESAEALQVPFVTRCTHIGGPTHKYAKECFPRHTALCIDDAELCDKGKADHKAVADMLMKYLGRQWPHVHVQLR